jgi:hypothetical protein
MLTGWTLTGIVTGNFVNVSPYGQHKLNVFPAGDLVISPSVAALTGLQADVVPGIPQHANRTTGQTLASAGVGGGGGQFQVSAQLHLTVPGRIPAGIYADLLVLTVS